MQYQGRSRRTKTGGRIRPHEKKRKYQLGRSPTETRIGAPSFRVVDTRGNTTKTRALATDVANVADGGETVRADLVNVVRNDANPNYVRRNIITKGAIVEVDLDGDRRQARVTSRPGQSGRVDAVLLAETAEVAEQHVDDEADTDDT